MYKLIIWGNFSIWCSLDEEWKKRALWSSWEVIQWAITAMITPNYPVALPKSFNNLNRYLEPCRPKFKLEKWEYAKEIQLFLLINYLEPPFPTVWLILIDEPKSTLI